jgi:type II secretory ATPase GspE/PulE/Tfp pilus assembly ATPase PilB-like protein
MRSWSSAKNYVAVDLGMRTLKHSAVDKILEGVTTVEEAYRVVSF